MTLPLPRSTPATQALLSPAKNEDAAESTSDPNPGRPSYNIGLKFPWLVSGTVCSLARTDTHSNARFRAANVGMMEYICHLQAIGGCPRIG